MTRRKIREEIFKLLFEHELIDNDIQKRIEEVVEEEKITKEDQINFLKSYVTEIIENEEILVNVNYFDFMKFFEQLGISNVKVFGGFNESEFVLEKSQPLIFVITKDD